QTVTVRVARLSGDTWTQIGEFGADVPSALLETVGTVAGQPAVVWLEKQPTRWLDHVVALDEGSGRWTAVGPPVGGFSIKTDLLDVDGEPFLTSPLVVARLAADRSAWLPIPDDAPCPLAMLSSAVVAGDPFTVVQNCDQVLDVRRLVPDYSPLTVSVHDG